MFSAHVEWNIAVFFRKHTRIRASSRSSVTECQWFIILTTFSLFSFIHFRSISSLSFFHRPSFEHWIERSIVVETEQHILKSVRVNWGDTSIIGAVVGRCRHWCTKKFHETPRRASNVVNKRLENRRGSYVPNDTNFRNGAVSSRLVKQLNVIDASA